jgi:hypothetical protein
MLSAPQVLSPSSYRIPLPAGDSCGRSSLFAIFFSEPETQKKDEQNKCQSKIKMGIHRFYPPGFPAWLGIALVSAVIQAGGDLQSLQ